MKFLLIGLGIVVIVGIIVYRVIRGKVIAFLCKTSAASIYETIRGVYAGEHDLQVSRREEFEDEELDFAKYDEVAEVLRTHGGRELGKVENLTVSEFHPENRTLLEAHVTADGKACVGTYQVSDIHVSDVISETERGRFIITTNAEADKLGPPPEAIKQTHSQGTSVAELLKSHEETVESYLRENPSESLREVTSLEEVINSNKRFSVIASKHRQSIGYLTESEVKAMSGSPAEEKIAQQLWVEFQRIAEEEDRAA